MKHRVKLSITAVVGLLIGYSFSHVEEYFDQAMSGRPSNVNAVEQLYLLSAGVTAFRQDEGRNPPEGNREFVAAMLGGNTLGRKYLDEGVFRFNERGELIDPWGTPYIILDDWIKSAGENRRFEGEIQESDDYRMIKARIDPEGRLWKLIYDKFDMPDP